MPLKSPEQVCRSALIADADVAAMVGTRVYPVIAPATADLPFVTWRRSGVQRQHTLAGPMGMPTVILTVDIYATTYEAVRDLADKCRRVLDGYGTAETDSVVVKNVSLDNEADGFVQLAGGEMPPVYSVTQTYSVMWSET
jgi:hypothetical protein